MTTVYIVDGENKEVIEQPMNDLSIDVNNEDGYASVLFHGAYVYFTKEEAEEKLQYLLSIYRTPTLREQQ